MWDFKFDAPQFHNFFRPEKHNDRLELDPNDPNDQWFMQEHLDLTPTKIKIQRQIEMQQKQQMVNHQTSMEIKILTKQETQSNSKANKQINSKKLLVNINKVEQTKPHQVNKSKQAKGFGGMILQKPIAQNKKPIKKLNEKLKRSAITQKYTKVPSQQPDFSFRVNNNKQKLKAQQPEYSKEQSKQQHNIQKQKINKIRSKSQSELNMNERQKVHIPCPYPRRIQKDWESKSNKSWYSLSQASAKKALNSMKKLDQHRKKSPDKSKAKFKF